MRLMNLHVLFLKRCPNIRICTEIVPHSDAKMDAHDAGKFEVKLR
jgi:hypothetical protein